MKKIFLLSLFLILFLNISLFSQIDSIKLACIGNSITEGSGLSNIPVDCYPAQLNAMLPDNWEVGNFGVSGRTMLKNGDYPIWVEKLFSDALAFLPDIVTIMLGTNDSKYYNWDDHKNEFYDDYVSMIDTFRSLSSNPEIYVCLPPKAFTGNFDINNAVISQEIIPIINQIAIDKNVKVIDLYTATEDKSNLFPEDGIHPDRWGANYLAKLLYTALTGDIVKEITDTNLALNKVADASGFYEDNSTSYPADLAADGDLRSYWGFEGIPAHIVIDMKSTFSIDMFQLFLLDDNTRGVQYKIETSLDNSNWTESVDNTSNTDTAGYVVNSINPVDARYIKLTITGCANNSDGIIKVSEFKALKNTGYFHAPLMYPDIAENNKSKLAIIPLAEDLSYRILFKYSESFAAYKMNKIVNKPEDEFDYSYTGNEENVWAFYCSAFKEGVEVYSEPLTLSYTDPVIEAIQNNIIDKLQIFPNPVNDLLSIFIKDIEIIDGGTIEIMDITGVRVFSQELNTNSHTISLENISQGLYFVKIQVKGNIYLKKFFKL